MTATDTPDDTFIVTRQKLCEEHRRTTAERDAFGTFAYRVQSL